ncbi:hypothetical protein Leryth_022718 [Lithospermum erythrorhizon]|nr:hypothetical protein Leryth_022718 [Lithospermum erythrorhizon]
MQIIISFLKVLVSSIRPSTEVLGRLPGSASFGDIIQYPMASKIPGVLIVRINSGSLCFANASFIKERILNLVKEQNDIEESGEDKVRSLMLDMSRIKLALVSPRWQVINKLKIADFIDKIGRGGIFLSVDEAVNACVEPKLLVS